MQNWPQTVISQYANSPTLLALLESIDEWINPDTNFDNFYNLILNIDTAVGYGLDVWGRIVGVVRVIEVASGMYFGFAQENNLALVGTFGQAPFYSGQPITGNFSLTDDAFRLLIFAKAAANITDGSIPSQNQILLNLFLGRGNCYVIDNLDMTMIYKFDFVLEPFEIAIVTTSGVLPRPCGVMATASYLT